MSLIKPGQRRVVTCEHTHVLVIQEWDGQEWLCLHNDSIQQDKAIALALLQDHPELEVVPQT
jgi:hypothetical protein